MKAKSIITLFTSFLLCFSAYAQSFEFGATGYKIVYLDNESPASTCLKYFTPNNGGYAFNGGNIVSLPSYDNSTSLTISSSATTYPLEMAGLGYFTLLFVNGPTCAQMNTVLSGPEQDSNYYHIKLSGNAKVKIRAKSNIPTEIKFGLAYTGYWNQVPGPYGGQGASSRASYAEGVVKTIALTSTMTDYELDFSDWTNRAKVNLYGIYIAEPNATVTIEELTIGSDSWSQYANHIKGNLYEDVNNDCTKQPEETRMANIIVEANDGDAVYYGITDNNGNYNIGVDSGTVRYAITPRLKERTQSFVSNTCFPGRVVNANGKSNDFCCSDFPLKVAHCASLSIKVNSDRRRRCFRSNSSIDYVNYGNASSAAVVKIEYPEFVIPISSVPAWTSKVGNTLIYEVGTLSAVGTGRIALIDSVICGREDIRGLAQCLKATISPKSQCVSNQTSWDGSSVAVVPYCENGVARFVVQNIGLEDMAGSSQYRLYSNDTLVFQSTFQLISGNTFQVRYPANAAVIRLEADQRPAHPGRSQPRAFVEGCGTSAAQTSVSLESLVLSVPQDDLDEEVAITCMTIVDSFDPNDKAAVPVGITDNHLVKAGEQLNYTIRFQNTGTDLAYTVKVVDTLDSNLDVASFTEGASSHPYTLQVGNDAYKTLLTFTFNNINLKDSTTSEPESHGFISFYIKSKEGLADGNTIHNKADIFFDYNSAIVTNVVDHTIGTYVPTDLSKGNKVEMTTGLFDGNETNVTQRLTLYPNPASDVVQVKLSQNINIGQLTIVDLSGHEVWSATLKGEITSVSLSGLPTGMYLYKVQSNGEFIGVGKLVVK